MDRTGAEIDEEEVYQSLPQGEILTLCKENDVSPYSKLCFV